MIGGFAHLLRTLVSPALRRLLASLVVLCLACGPFAGALSAHHVDDGDAEIAMSLEAQPDSVTAKVSVRAAPDHGPDLPAVDHDCHGCATAMIAAPACLSTHQLRLPVHSGPSALVEGRFPGADFRPPKA